jgi:hypothetical protein
VKEHCPLRLAGIEQPLHMPCDTGDFSKDGPAPEDATPTAAGSDAGSEQGQGEDGLAATVMIHSLEPHPANGAYRIAKVGLDEGTSWACQVIVRDGDFEVNDLAVYIVLGAKLPDEPEFSHLGSDRHNGLRERDILGEKSQGMLLKAEEAANLLARRASHVGGGTLGDGGPYYRRVALEALYELGTGQDVSQGLGIRS